MNIHQVLAVANPNDFTGFEHTRIVDLLTVLAFISIAMWAVVCLSLLIRQGAILVIRLVKYSRTHHISALKYIGKNNGS